MKKSEIKAMLNMPQAAAIIAKKYEGMTYQLLRYYVKEYETPEHIRIGRNVFFEREAVENWVKPPSRLKGPRHAKR